MKTTHSAFAAAVRRRAEERLQAREQSPKPESDTQRLLDELQVHQIELEMRNEKLRRSQAELKAARARYFDFYNLAPVGYLTLSEPGLILEANRTGATLLGIVRPRLLNRRFSRFVHAEDRSAFEALLTRAFETRAPQVGEVRLSTKGRPPLTVQLRAWVSGDGQECRIVLTDFTERKQAETALKESEERFRILFDRANDGIFLLSADGELLSVNESFARMHGYSVKEMLSMSLKDLDTPETFELAPARIRRLLAGESLTFEVNHYHKDGHVFPLEASASLISSGGKSFLQSFHRDITVRKRTEEELRASHQQLRALAARLQAVREEERTSVAREIHDVLAQELTRLKMDVVWLNRQLAQPLDAPKQKAVQERLTVMTAVTDTAIQSVQKIATDLRPVVLDSLGLSAAVEWQARDLQARTGIVCTATVPEQDVPLDRDRSTAMFRVLQESLTNVLRHAQATRVEVLLRTEGGQLLLRIQDNGCGIPPATLSNPKSIGLAGMRERALLLNGQLEIRSQPESGTIIEMRLPLSKNENENPPEGKP